MRWFIFIQKILIFDVVHFAQLGSMRLVAMTLRSITNVKHWIYVLNLSVKSNCVSITLPETNIVPGNGWLEYCFPFGMAYLSVAMLVSGSVVKIIS